MVTSWLEDQQLQPASPAAYPKELKLQRVAAKSNASSLELDDPDDECHIDVAWGEKEVFKPKNPRGRSPTARSLGETTPLQHLLEVHVEEEDIMPEKEKVEVRQPQQPLRVQQPLVDQKWIFK